jgi:hypothetical protein
MVARATRSPDYEFVILPFGCDRFGFPEFFPWQADKPATRAKTQPSLSKETVMNTTKLIAALALSFAASGAALAQEATYEYPQVSTSTVTRAQVIAELQQARLDGSLRISEGETHKPAVFIAQRSRADVRAEAKAAAASGEQRQLNGETNAFEVAIKPAAAPAGATAIANVNANPASVR